LFVMLVFNLCKMAMTSNLALLALYLPMNKFRKLSFVV
jgi:hypothetical protein